jgi:hypothetical protein
VAKKRYQVSKKGDDNMATVLYLDKKTEKTKPYSFSDMIFDSKKRKQTFDYYDENYDETKEEKEILKLMNNRKKGEESK